MPKPFATAIKEAFGRAAFALTHARWASEMISEARLLRRIARMERDHLRAGGRIVTVRQAGMSHTSFEAA